jgi:hypothetical protein
MHPRLLAIGAAVWLGLCATGFAQFKGGEEPGGIRFGETKTQKWRCGVQVDAFGGPCRNIIGYIAFPSEWPEQEVRIVGEDISPEAKVSYETLDGTAKLMMVKIPFLGGGHSAKAILTLEIHRRAILAPADTSVYRLPDVKKLDRRVTPYLATSPKIESTHPQIRQLAKEIGADKERSWERVEAIYDWVRANVEYKNGPLKGALAALRDKTGDCEEMTSLFIAICRAAGIPARTVWVPGHCYPEFYLVDAQGRGHWFPCQAAGERAFGAIPELRPILQKGDNFRPPWNRRDSLRYLKEYLTGEPVGHGGKPRVLFVRELIAE